MSQREGNSYKPQCQGNSYKPCSLSLLLLSRYKANTIDLTLRRYLHCVKPVLIRGAYHEAKQHRSYAKPFPPGTKTKDHFVSVWFCLEERGAETERSAILRERTRGACHRQSDQQRDSPKDGTIGQIPKDGVERICAFPMS